MLFVFAEHDLSLILKKKFKFLEDHLTVNFEFPTFFLTPSYIIFEIVTYMWGVFLVLNKLVSFQKNNKKISFTNTTSF